MKQPLEPQDRSSKQQVATGRWQSHHQIGLPKRTITVRPHTQDEVEQLHLWLSRAMIVLLWVGIGTVGVAIGLLLRWGLK